PERLMTAAELRASLSAEDAAQFSTFRSRAAEDFPDEALRTDLFRPPPGFPTLHELRGWTWSMASALRYSCVTERAAAESVSKLMRWRSVVHDQELDLAVAAVLVEYAMMLASSGHSDVSFSVFTELLTLAQSTPHVPELAWYASHLGQELGCDRLG